MKTLGYCANCYQDIIEGDHSDCCGKLMLVPMSPTLPKYIPDEAQDNEDQMEYERTFVPE